VATRDAEHAGASKSSIERHGLWLLDALSGSYLDKTLPLESIRALAGVVLPTKGTMFWARNSIIPPDALLAKVFPWIEKGELQVQESIRLHKTEYSGSGFLKVLKYLRIIILQDAVAYMNNSVFSRHPIFKDPLFSTTEFLTFKGQLEHHLQEGDVPKNAMLERVL
jgi:hypothetical protein